MLNLMPIRGAHRHKGVERDTEQEREKRVRERKREWVEAINIIRKLNHSDVSKSVISFDTLYLVSSQREKKKKERKIEWNEWGRELLRWLLS